MLQVKPQPEAGTARGVPAAGVSIAEAARRTGVSVYTLRYYERAGLVVAAVDRTAGGRRRYHQLDLDWIVVCSRLRATGMPIKTIQRYAGLVGAGRGNEPERLALLEAHRADVSARLAEIQENLEIIDHKIDVYRGRLAAGDADQLWAPNRLADGRAAIPAPVRPRAEHPPDGAAGAGRRAVEAEPGKPGPGVQAAANATPASRRETSQSRTASVASRADR